MIDTPELDKQRDIINSNEHEVLGRFYDWLGENGYYIAEYVQYEGLNEPTMSSISKSPNQLIAEFFEINLDKIESERRAILEELKSNVNQ